VFRVIRRLALAIGSMAAGYLIIGAVSVIVAGQLVEGPLPGIFALILGALIYISLIRRIDPPSPFLPRDD